MTIVWNGNLRDDCTAYLGDLCLRAEKMDRAVWWWAIYNKRGKAGCDQLAAVYDTPRCRVTTGAKARAAAEAKARQLTAEANAA